MKYRTIVADPPWSYPDSWGVTRTPQGVEHDGRRARLPYEQLTLEQIKAIPVAELADAEGSHLYLWTTNRYLHEAFHVVKAWGFRFGQTLIWAKTPLPSVQGGAFSANVEFVLFCRYGSLRHLRRQPSMWFNWPRQARQHSRKPDAFYDLVEGTSPGPYLELFARRQRLGWDTWGDEALEHVQLETS